MNITLKLTGALALMSALLIGCSASSSSGGGGTAGGTNTDVTLSGVVSTTNSTTASVSGGINKTTGGVAPAALTGYTLYCVTFTSTTHSGTGDLTVDPNDATKYTYSFTIANAAGLPIGCFINDSTNTPVSTVTFNISGSSGDLSSSTSGTALTGGSHTVNISFNPTTGASTATVQSTSVDSSATTSGGTATTMLTAMAGAWNMACPGSVPAGISGLPSGTTLTQAQWDSLTKCQQFLYANDDGNGVYIWKGSSTGFPVYLNFVSGTLSGNTVHAMGVWANQAAYTACGSTEGMDSTALGTIGVTGLSQIDGSGSPDVAFDDATSGADLAGLVAGGAYSSTTVANSNGGYDTSVSTTLAKLVAALPPEGLNAGTANATPVYDPTFNDQWVGGGGDWCPNAGQPSPFTMSSATLLNDATQAGANARSCYVGWVESLAETQGPGSSPVEACLPHIDGNSVQNQIWPSSTTTTFPLASAITVKYRTSLGGISPDIGNRYALMGLNLVSNTAVANNHQEQQWSYWDPNANSGAGDNVTCNFAEDMSITMIPDLSSSPAATATGHFDIKDYQNCVDSTNTAVSAPGTGDTYATFDVNFAR